MLTAIRLANEIGDLLKKGEGEKKPLFERITALKNSTFNDQWQGWMSQVMPYLQDGFPPADTRSLNMPYASLEKYKSSEENKAKDAKTSEKDKAIAKANADDIERILIKIATANTNLTKIPIIVERPVSPGPENGERSAGSYFRGLSLTRTHDN